MRSNHDFDFEARLQSHSDLFSFLTHTSTTNLDIALPTV